MNASHRPQPDASRALSMLSLRERQVLSLLARGESTRHIALMLSISRRTVDAHSASINRKLGAENRARAVAIAIRAGILAHDEE